MPFFTRCTGGARHGADRAGLEEFCFLGRSCYIFCQLNAAEIFLPNGQNDPLQRYENYGNWPRIYNTLIRNGFPQPSGELHPPQAAFSTAQHCLFSAGTHPSPHPSIPLQSVPGHGPAAWAPSGKMSSSQASGGFLFLPAPAREEGQESDTSCEKLGPEKLLSLHANSRVRAPTLRPGHHQERPAPPKTVPRMLREAAFITELLSPFKL